MPKIIVETKFKHSDDGNAVITYAPGEHDVSERCATVAIEQLKVARPAGTAKQPGPDKDKAQRPSLKKKSS
jgi:hypothetical protein